MDIDGPGPSVVRLGALAAATGGPTGPRLRTDPSVDGRSAPWVEKYRPKSLDDVAAHTEIIDTSEWPPSHTPRSGL